MNRKVKFLGCFFVLLALIVCNIAGNANAFPTHKECWYLGKYSYNQLCEKVKKGDWDDFKFHVWLTIKTIELVENYYGIQLPDELKQEIIIGSFEEDYDMQGTADCARYNAIGNEAVLTIIASIRCENHFYGYPGDKEGLTYGANEELNVSALAWALDSFCNNYDAKDGYNSGLSKKFFRSLGHVLHLLQDTGSPAHARNDNHALTKGEDYYETALENMTFENYATKAVLPESPIIAGNTLQSFFDEMQKFTCRNFFSNDTMFENFHEGVNLPFDGH